MPKIRSAWTSILLAVLVFPLPYSAFAETNVFSCEGYNTGESILDSFHKFDIEVGVDPFVFKGPQGILQVCNHYNRTYEYEEFMCNIGDTEIKCECDGGTGFFNSTTITFSRYSGTMKIISLVSQTRNPDLWIANYQCTKVDKLF